MSHATLLHVYKELKTLSSLDLKSSAVTIKLVELAHESRDFLKTCDVTPITSKIPGKQYMVFNLGDKFSRPVNTALFDIDIPNEELSHFLQHSFEQMDSQRLAILLYTVAMCYCAAMDLIGTGDKKTPATFFEIYVGNLFARQLGINPTKDLTATIVGVTANMKTDFLFKPEGEGLTYIHLPVKITTRERAIMAWAHQRILDGVAGTNHFHGILVSMSETNFQRASMSVVEVCVPDQWRLYQMYVSQLQRIYYLDVPDAYAKLNDTFPRIAVKHLAEFLKEKDALISQRP